MPMRGAERFVRNIVFVQQAVRCLQMCSRLRLSKKPPGWPGSHLCTKHHCPTGVTLVTQFGFAPLLLRPLVDGRHDRLP